MDRRTFLATGSACLLASCSDASLNRPLYSADSQSADYPTVKAVEEMGRLLRERTDGRLDVKVFAGGQLGVERDTLEITTFGGLDMNRIFLGAVNAVEPTTVVAALPFLFRSTAHMRAALDGPAGDDILASLWPHDLVGLCFYDSGQRSFYNVRGPIERPQDMAGLKLRVPNSDLFVAMVRALGANPSPMAFGEVYQALVQGVIDGAENNMPAYDSTRHFEAAPYFSTTGHAMTPDMLVMSRARWERLGKTDREIVRECAKLSVPYMRELWDARVVAARERVVAGGARINTIPDISLFSERMAPVWERFVTTDRQKRLVKMIQETEG